jgi:hypothetical protein
MFGVDQFSFNFLTSTPFLVIAALIVLLGLGVVLYRKTNPPTPLWVRLLLGTLRILALLALVAVLSEPILDYSRSFERTRRVAILSDVSTSMDRNESERTRIERADSLLNSRVWKTTVGAVETEHFFFADSLKRTKEGLVRDKTAIGDALDELRTRQLEQPFDQWLLLTDGGSNAGVEPTEVASRLGTPVIAVNLSGREERLDIKLDNLTFDPVAFVGRKTELAARINWRNANDRVARVRLYDGTRMLDEKTTPLQQDDGLAEIKLNYTPEQPGQKLYRIEIVPTEDEVSEANNRRSIAIKVLKSRLTVLLVTEHPDLEVGFLRRYLEQADRYDVELVVTGRKSGNLQGQLPANQAAMNRYDLIILHDPDPQRIETRKELFKSYLEDKGGSLWVILGQTYARRGPTEWFDNLLPFTRSSRGSAQFIDFNADPVEGNLFHPSVRLADDRASIRRRWNELPPFDELVFCDLEKSEAVILATTTVTEIVGHRSPILGYLRHGPGKVLEQAALPFWPWGFVATGFGDDGSAYADFVEGTVSWLTVQDDFDPVRIVPEKKVFSRGEDVQFDGFAYDLGYRPLPNAAGYVKLHNTETGTELEADLLDRQPGQYRATFSQLPPGKYDYSGAFEKDGRTLKEVDGQILVESFSLEEYDQEGDTETLKTIARLSGGEYFSYLDFDKAAEAIKTEPAVVVQRGEIIVWNKVWLLLLIIAALSIEWLLRKVWQMV